MYYLTMYYLGLGARKKDNGAKTDMHTFAIVEAGGERTATPYFRKLFIKSKEYPTKDFMMNS